MQVIEGDFLGTELIEMEVIAGRNIESVRNGDSRATEIVTVHQYESGVSQPRRATLDVIRRVFESAGVEFIDENGDDQWRICFEWPKSASGPINVEIVDYH